MITEQQIRKLYQDHTPEPVYRHKFFSVLMPFVVKDGKLCLMFEVRSRTMESQPGEICFPGGHIEKGEDPLDCALRETEEETGIPISEIEVIGPADMICGYANYTLYSYAAVIPYEAYLNAQIAPDEVEELFLMPVEEFRNVPKVEFIENIHTEIDPHFPYEKVRISKNYAWRVGQWPIPIYDFGDRIIWGLTAQLVGKMLQNLEREGL